MRELLIMSKKEVSRISIIEQLREKKLTQIKAAEAMDISDRQVRRILKRFKRAGPLGLIHGLRGKQSNHQIEPSLIEKALKLVEEKYADFGPTLAAEKLAEIDDLKIDHDTLRRKMATKHLWRPKKRKIKHRAWRERKESFGEMLQFDGSHHDWFENRGKRCVLLCSRDDATNQTEAMFAPAEDTLDVFRFWKSYFQKYGQPKSIYLDRHSIYKTTRPIQGQGEDFDLTQFERAMAELGIEVIHAYSPQAKGRVENVFGTLQDRLVKELRLEEISDIASANQYLKNKFLPKFNQRFSLSAKLSANLHQPLDNNTNLDKILSIRKTRYINNDFTLRFESRWFQLNEIQPTLVLPCQKVTVEKHLDGQLKISLGGKYLNFREIPKRVTPERPAIALTSNPQPPRIYSRPAANHPWRKFNLARPAYVN